MSIKHFQARLEKFDTDLWHYHIPVPKEISAYYRSKNIKRLICKLNDDIQIHCALMPMGDGDYFININKDVRKKSKWEVGQYREIQLLPDESKYGMEISPEFQEVLNTDIDGHSIFEKLTPGKQRNLIYLATKPKTSHTRLKKSIIIIDYLKSCKGQIDFKELNQAFKDRKNDF